MEYRKTEDGLLEERIPQSDIVILRTRSDADKELQVARDAVANKESELEGARRDVERLQGIVERCEELGVV